MEDREAKSIWKRLTTHVNPSIASDVSMSPPIYKFGIGGIVAACLKLPAPGFSADGYGTVVGKSKRF